MKIVTSATLHTTSEGQRLSYTYSEVDEITGKITSENIRENMVVIPTKQNEKLISAIKEIQAYITNKINAEDE